MNISSLEYPVRAYPHHIFVKYVCNGLRVGFNFGCIEP